MAKFPVDRYLRTGSPEQSSWRSIVLFGKNTSSYKFALAQSLMQLARQGRDSVTLDELAVPFATRICEHAKTAPRQSTNPSNRLLDACLGFNEGTVTLDELTETTVRSGFRYVPDAFHVVNAGEVPVTFFRKDFSRGPKRISLTDEAFRLATSPEASNIAQETESRWNLVETAWEQGVNPSLLRISYDGLGQALVAESGIRRKNITSVRGSLDGYQKGRCFYFRAPISTADGTGTALTAGGLTLPGHVGAPLCDVDHFFPHALASQVPDVNWDGVWNLVLACPECNRGAGGKFARVPAVEYLERLNRRNEYLIASHHPLRETLIAQTGATPEARWNFLKKADKVAGDCLPGERWRCEQRGDPAF